MAQITLDGYNDIKAYVQANWTSFVISDPSGTQILRLSTSDSRITWSASDVNPIIATIVLNGSDSDLSGILPKTFGQIELRKDSEDVNGMTAVETFTTFTMTSTADQLTIKFNIQFPA